MPTGYNLTADERVGYEFDLTHGHPYRTPFPAELEAIDLRARFAKGPTSIREAKEAESEFIDAFMGMSGQEVQPDEAHDTLQLCASTASMKAFANLCR